MAVACGVNPEIVVTTRGCEPTWGQSDFRRASNRWDAGALGDWSSRRLLSRHSRMKSAASRLTAVPGRFSTRVLVESRARNSDELGNEGVVRRRN